MIGSQVLEIKVYDETSLDRQQARDYIAGKIGAVLMKHYPGRSWYAEIRLEQGVAYICQPKISMQHGYLIKLDGTIEEIENRAMRAGGEVLERFRMSRSRLAKAGEGLLGLKTNLLGEAVGADKGEG